ncbi:MAG: D-sedoheptulose 7-phosphate isomerase [Planctomycetota bacterium]|jgi:D-sedoheptulose 7-phosphate isomerase
MKRSEELTQRVAERIGEAVEAHRLLAEQAGQIARIAEVLIDCMKAGGQALFCGNGGSAADAQHLACELQGRFYLDRRALPATALNVNSSTLTAVANDYGYETVFARQVEALGRKGDLLFGLSTSGDSPNVLRAVEAAAGLGITTVALTGRGGGRLADAADHALRVPSEDTPRIQECHILAGHILCELAEAALCGPGAA